MLYPNLVAFVEDEHLFLKSGLYEFPLNTYYVEQRQPDVHGSPAFSTIKVSSREEGLALLQKDGKVTISISKQYGHEPKYLKSKAEGKSVVNQQK